MWFVGELEAGSKQQADINPKCFITENKIKGLGCLSWQSFRLR